MDDINVYIIYLHLKIFFSSFFINGEQEYLFLIFLPHYRLYKNKMFYLETNSCIELPYVDHNQLDGTLYHL